MNFKKIGIPIVALIAIVVGLMRNLDTTTIVGNQVTEQTTEQNSNTEVVDFELNNEKTGGKTDNLQPRNVEVSLSHKPFLPLPVPKPRALRGRLTSLLLNAIT